MFNLEETLIRTDPVREAARMVGTLTTTVGGPNIGQLLGEPGTGKTMAGQWLAQENHGVRVCAGQHMTDKELITRIVGKVVGSKDGTLWDMMGYLEEAGSIQKGRLIVVDEANHLRWQQLELLRWLADEGAFSVLLIGTELLERTFSDSRTSVLLSQLSSRIGAKRVLFRRFDVTETAAYCLGPRFGKVSNAVAKTFHRYCHGYWRDASQLADACGRLLNTQNKTTLDAAIVEAAGAWMAPGRKA